MLVRKRPEKALKRPPAGLVNILLKSLLKAKQSFANLLAKYTIYADTCVLIETVFYQFLKSANQTKNNLLYRL
jgi:hypothetical protein